MTVRVKIVSLPEAHGLLLPTYATSGAAGADVCAAVKADVVIPPGGRMAIPTGLMVAVPEGYEMQIRPRSGLALHHGVTVANAPGTIDSDYRGEIKVILVNLGSEPFTIRRGDRIAQLVIAPVVRTEFEMVNELPQTHRGDGGFGSTGR